MAFKEAYTAQSALKTCADHGHEELHMFCKTCKKPICAVCLKKVHINHDWDMMKNIVRQLRADNIRRKLEVESILKSMNLGTTEILDNIASENEESFTRNISDLESTRIAMHRMVDDKIDDMKEKCQMHRNKIHKDVKDKKGGISPKVDRLQFLLAHMEEAAADYTDYDVIEFHDELTELLIDLRSIAMIPPRFHEKMVYRTTTLDKAVIVSMLGSVHTVTKSPSSVSVFPISDFNCGEKFVNCIWPISKDEAWIHCGRSTLNTLTDITGHKKKSVDICRCFNFSLSDNATVYFCDRRDTQSVMILDESGIVKTLFTPAPLIPTRISLTRSGDLLVSLVEEVSDNRTSTSRRLVRKVTRKGTAIREYEFDSDGETPLFNKPGKPLELHNGDIYLFNEYMNESGKAYGSVFGFDSCGVLRIKYNGSKDEFNPLDICCDTMDNIFVTDSRNKCVHFLDYEGRFVQYLLTEQTLSFKPYAIAVFEDRLWISDRNNGNVKVYSILNQ